MSDDFDDFVEPPVMDQLNQLRDDIKGQWTRDLAHLNVQAADAMEAVDCVMAAEFVEHEKQWLESVLCDRDDLHGEHSWEHETKGTVLCAGKSEEKHR